MKLPQHDELPRSWWPVHWSITDNQSKKSIEGARLRSIKIPHFNVASFPCFQASQTNSTISDKSTELSKSIPTHMNALNSWNYTKILPHADRETATTPPLPIHVWSSHPSIQNDLGYPVLRFHPKAAWAMIAKNPKNPNKIPKNNWQRSLLLPLRLPEHLRRISRCRIISAIHCWLTIQWANLLYYWEVWETLKKLRSRSF